MQDGGEQLRLQALRLGADLGAISARRYATEQSQRSVSLLRANKDLKHSLQEAGEDGAGVYAYF